MEGPFDPQQPAPDAGAQQAAGQDDDLHALLERLLGQGDVRPVGTGTDDLWPDLFPAAASDEVSTIVPAPEAPAAMVDAPIAADALPAADVRAADLAAAGDGPARAGEAVVVDSGTSTNVDDIHAAILASVSVELEPIAPAVPAAPADAEPALPVRADLLLADALAGEAVVDLTVAEPATEPVPADAAEPEGPAGTVTYLFAAEPIVPEPFDAQPSDVEPFDAETFHPESFHPGPFGAEPVAADAAAAEPDAAEPFALTPFEESPAPAAATDDVDTDALWAAAVPELGLDIAPPLDLDGDDDQVPASTAVVLPWPTQEPKAPAPAAPHDLIEAALANVAADFTTEPVEPLRTAEVAAATAHVVFRLGSRVMAVPLAAVSEIARPPRFTRLPHVPSWVLGIANLRGDIVSILDLKGFFSGKVGQSSHEQRMLALRPAGDEVRTAVLVDSVDGIQAFEDARIARVTRGFDGEVAPFARGLYQTENELIVVLDADRLLQSKPMRQFEDGAGAR